VKEVYIYGPGLTKVYLKSEVDALLEGREPEKVQTRERPRANSGPRVFYKRNRRT